MEDHSAIDNVLWTWRGEPASTQAKRHVRVRRDNVDNRLSESKDIERALGPEVDDYTVPGTKLNIAYYFQHSGYSARRLALVLDLSELAMVSLLKDKNTMVRMETLDRLAWAFGCKPGDLLQGTPHRPAVGRFDLLLLPRAVDRIKDLEEQEANGVVPSPVEEASSSQDEIVAEEYPAHSSPA